MFRKFILATALFGAGISAAYAQSTAQPVLPGSLTTSGCPGSISPCYLPYSNSNPLPVSASITPSGTQDTNLKQVNGATVNVGAGAAGTGTQRVTTSSDSSLTANQGTAAAVSGGWPVINGEPADTTGTFTNATQSTAITTPSVDGYETATITINGTYGTATGTFVASDDGGTTFYTIRCARTDTAVAEAGYTSLTNTNRAWYCPVHSFDVIRVQSSAVASGTVNVRISISSSPTTAGATVGVSADSTVGVEGLDQSTQSSAANPIASTIYDTNGTRADFTQPTLVVSTQQLPNAATASYASATGTTGATTATLASQSGKTNFLCGFSIRANATAAATGNATVTGILGGTLNFTQWTAPLATNIGLVEERFSPCLQASGVTTAIAVISAAPGTGGTVSVTADGYFK